MDKYNFETLDGKVDLKKVRELRRAIRRRYANRKNIQKIFTQWDRENKGFVSIKNMHDMLQDLGHKINFDEARVLLASANKSKSN